MSLRVDLEKRTLSVSPGLLLQGLARRIGFDRGESFERMWIGQAVHRRVLGQALAEVPGYEPERVVRHVFPVDDFSVTFEGRVDGRFTEEDGTVVVDEVKSLHFAEDLPRLGGSPRLDRFLWQLRWYLHAVAGSEGKRVRGRLVLADIETGDTRVQDVAYDAATVSADLARRVRALLSALFSEQALADAKAAEAQTLAFPYATYRPGQLEMAAAVARAAANEGHLLVEAPTGIGKTAAALVPLVREALRRGRKVFVLTAKTTQQEMFEKTLAALGSDALRSVRLRAKERMCANDVLLCHESHCAFAKDYGAKMEASGLLERLLDTHRHLAPDLIFEEARSEVVCPFEVSLELAERADVVIGDYNYAFDPIVSLSGVKEPGALAGAHLLVDEAHNLIERGRSTYSPELSERELDRLEQGLGVSSARSVLEAEEALRSIRALVRESADSLEGDAAEATDLVTLDEARLEDLRLSTEALLVRHLADLRAGGTRVPDDPVVELAFSYFRFHDVSRLAARDGVPDPAFDVLARRSPAGARLSILCKDPSRLLGATLNGSAGAVAMSATLSPPEFHRDLLGLDPDRTEILRLRSPFPRENRLVLVAPDVDTTYSARSSGAPRLAALVAGVARSCPGNVLSLFPSYRFLDEVRAHLPPLPARRVLRPSDRSTERERGAALDALRDGGAPVLLLTVSGGAFAEGVDYKGEMLSAVVVVSPALPQVRFEQERMRQYFEERFEKGFEYAYVIPGMTRVVQSAGRLIRSESDVGVIVLACRRFLKNPYRRYLPGDWYVDAPEEMAELAVEERTRAFFARVARGELPVGAAIIP